MNRIRTTCREARGAPLRRIWGHRETPQTRDFRAERGRRRWEIDGEPPERPAEASQDAFVLPSLCERIHTKYHSLPVLSNPVLREVPDPSPRPIQFHRWVRFQGSGQRFLIIISVPARDFSNVHVCCVRLRGPQNHRTFERVARYLVPRRHFLLPGSPPAADFSIPADRWLALGQLRVHVHEGKRRLFHRPGPRFYSRLVLEQYHTDK